MTDVSVERAMVTLGGAGDQEWELFHGATFPGLYALMARRHMLEYGTTEEQMACVAVKNHRNGALNPKAQYQKEVTIEEVMKSSPVATPLKLLDCSPITDGAAVVILAEEASARKYCEKPVWIEASAQASDTLALHDRKSISQTEATIKAGKEAYRQADLKPNDIDFAEVHDCFTIAEIMAIEALGFCQMGKGGKFTEEGNTAREGSIPVNTSGGLKAKGHPVGATGIAQAIEATLQLRGDAGKRQIKDAEVGLTHNVGGSGATCVVHIMRRGA
jgi:acetyl-CoA C-acetyltransferase